MRLGVFSGQKSVCRVYENCDRSNVLASIYIALSYRPGVLFFPHSLMTRRIFSTFAFQLSPKSEASKVDEKRVPRLFMFLFFIEMLLCSPVFSFLVPNQMPTAISCSSFKVIVVSSANCLIFVLPLFWACVVCISNP